MRRVAGRIFVICCAAASACTNATPEPPVVQNGWLHFTTSRARQMIPCSNMPIQLDGNRTETSLTGFCRNLRIAGEHNDVRVQVAPGATIDVVGRHNDVWWRQMGPGPRPALLDSGGSNSFHREES
jgi:Protein of unknown function (DUF3060)